ncbi:AP-5 complex subunit mu-1 [Histomonas meleagridis]|uniref:AP-5 complex subunit mu-1 n=1 Tax=Histomonas meleagridis TaxID=135588 RepID=UPI0035597813|nr:AP-5 complex subunit mu-1 [Histomonas meleagridis]KAH0800777.1 AP-5 complex subunit mu-1 [Histomonas meleagridis]
MNPNSPPSAYASFRQLINQILPFGSPIVHDAYFASQLISPGDLRRFSAGYQVVAPSPIPSWKVSLLFSRPQIELKLREVIFGSIDGQNNTYTVYGELKSVASINYLPDITAKVKGLENVLDLSGHYCVKKIEKDQIVFSPPTGVAQLLLWKSNVDPTKPPVDGIYEIFEDEVGLHFSLTITVKENVKTVTAQLPFPGRSSLTKHQFQNPGGQLKMSKKEATVMWLAKFSEQKSLTLTGILNFESNESTSKERCRAYISFKSKKKSFTGIEVEKDSVTFNPSGNVNVTTELSYTTENKKYIFWATQGNH